MGIVQASPGIHPSLGSIVVPRVDQHHPIWLLGRLLMRLANGLAYATATFVRDAAKETLPSLDCGLWSLPSKLDRPSALPSATAYHLLVAPAPLTYLPTLPN